METSFVRHEVDVSTEMTCDCVETSFNCFLGVHCVVLSFDLLDRGLDCVAASVRSGKVEPDSILTPGRECVKIRSGFSTYDCVEASRTMRTSSFVRGDEDL